ncbi:hypothetical protein ACQ4LE_009297 [Meloidogyne hapla]
MENKQNREDNNNIKNNYNKLNLPLELLFDIINAANTSDMIVINDDNTTKKTTMILKLKEYFVKLMSSTIVYAFAGENFKKMFEKFKIKMSGPGPNNEIDKDEIIRQQNELIRELRQQVAFFREALFTEPIELTSLEENLEEVIPGGSGIQSTVQDNGNTDENPPSSTMPLFSNNSVSTQQSCGNTRLYGLPFAGHETYPAHSVILSEQAAQPRQNYGNESGEVNVTPSAMPLFNINTTNTITNWATHQSSVSATTPAVFGSYDLSNIGLYGHNSGQRAFPGNYGTYPAQSMILSGQVQPRQNYTITAGENAHPTITSNSTTWTTQQTSGTSATTAICDDYILFNNRLYTNNSGQISFDGHGAYTGQSMISAGQLAQPRQSTGAGNASNNNTTWTQQSSCASATTRAGSGCYDLCNIGLHGNSGKRPFPGNYGYYPGQSITSGGPSQGSHPRQNYGTGSGGESGGSGAPPLKKKTKIDNKSGDSAGCSNMYEYNNIVLKPIEMQLPNNQGTKINSGNQSIQQKQKRTKLSDEQLMILRQNLDINNAPTAEQIKQIAQQTHLTENRIKNWYRNTLFKLRHYDDEEDEQ